MKEDFTYYYGYGYNEIDLMIEQLKFKKAIKNCEIRKSQDWYELKKKYFPCLIDDNIL